MTILVTGGAGFIGSNFILGWLAAGQGPVVCLDKLTYAGNRANLAAAEGRNDFRFVHAGIEDFDAVSVLLADQAVRAIVNLAAESHVDRSILGPEAFVQTNVIGTTRLLAAAKAHWTRLGAEERAGFRFVHVSTDEVYGTLAPDDPAFTEDHPLQPNSPYAASKASSDHMVRAYGETYGLPVLITRCSNNYGPYQFPEKLIPLVIHNALKGLPLPIYGDGKQVRDWLHVADHCSAIARVLADGRPGHCYNIGGNSERTNLEVVRGICAILDRLRPRADGARYEAQISFVRDRPGHDRRYAINPRKIAGELGWLPQESFEGGLERTVRWYLDHAGWVENVTSGEYRNWVAAQYA